MTLPGAPPADMSKSAKRRAAKKARDAAHVVEEEPAPAPVAPPAKPQAKNPSAATPAPAQAKPQTGANPKAAEQPVPQAKSKAKGQAKAEAAPVVEPAGKAAAKATGKSKAKGKAKAAAAPAEQPQAPAGGEASNFVIDDGTGGEWEVCKGNTKKPQKKKDKTDESANSNKNETESAAPAKKPATSLSQEARQARIESAAKAEVDRILNMKAPAQETAKAEEEDLGHVSATVTVQDGRVGIIIGPNGGSTIKMLTERGPVAKIDNSGNVFTITGLPEGVAKVELAIKELDEKGYASLAYDDFSESAIMVPKASVPELIGERGSMIRAMKDHTGCVINFPNVPRDAPDSRKIKVSIAGDGNKVELTKDIMNSIVMYHHHEVTHPGQEHQELDIEAAHYKFIIGAKGSEMRHIQNSFKVQVYIPREEGASDKVLVVGEPDSVVRACAYIEKQVCEKGSRQNSRTDVKGDDHWGDGDEELDEEARRYMYRR